MSTNEIEDALDLLRMMTRDVRVDGEHPDVARAMVSAQLDRIRYWCLVMDDRCDRLQEHADAMERAADLNLNEIELRFGLSGQALKAATDRTRAHLSRGLGCGMGEHGTVEMAKMAADRLLEHGKDGV